MWRVFTDEAVAEHPALLEVRPLTVGEWRKLEQLNEDAKQTFVLENCTRIDGVPGGNSVDVHVATALIRGVMANPWTGPQRTA